MSKPQGRMKMSGDVHPPELESDIETFEDPEYETSADRSREPAQMHRTSPPRWAPWLIGFGLFYLVARALRS